MKFFTDKREAYSQRPHVHVVRGKGRGNDMKVWLDDDGIVLGPVKGEFSSQDVKDALKLVEDFRDRFKEEWRKAHERAVARRRSAEKTSRTKK